MQQLCSGGQRPPFWIYWVVISILVIRLTNAWNINLESKQVVDAESLGWSFRGSSSHGAYFKLVESDGEALLLGGRNAIYNLSLNGLHLQKILEWSPTPKDAEICRIKGKFEEECQNYIRVLVRQTGGRILVCGTNAYKPMCRQYILNEANDYQIQREFSGFAISPYDPRHNSTSFYVSETDELYTGTVSDFTGSDPLIYRKPFSGSMTELRTQRNNMRCLNDPNFISAVDDEDSIYLFFRETALEYVNCGGNTGVKATYSRVGRVCKSDQGGARSYSDTWTSFTKARLNCSLPGPVSFYFDELQSTAILTESANGKGVIYAVFTTPYNGLRASAVCAFRLQDVKLVLTQSAFKNQHGPTSIWGPIGEKDAPSPRPGMCGQDSRTLTDDVLKFVQRNSLVDEAIPSLFSEPLFVHSDLKSQFTHIAVHPNVPAVDGKKYDVTFVGTNDGRVFKFVTLKRGDGIRSVLVEVIKVFSDGRPIDNFMIHLPSVDPKNTLSDQKLEGSLLVISEKEIKALPLHNCQNKTSCGSCVSLQDPHCAWNELTHSCVGSYNGHWSDSSYKQSVESGLAASCPEGGPDDKTLFAFNDLSPPQPVSNQKPLANGTELNMAVAIIVTLTIAASLGFLIGYRCSRWKAANSGTEYASSSTSSASGPCYAPAPIRHPIDVYSGGDGLASSPIPKFINDEEAASLVLCFSKDERDTVYSKTENDKFLNNGNGTMSREYKVKKIYV